MKKFIIVLLVCILAAGISCCSANGESQAAQTNDAVQSPLQAVKTAAQTGDPESSEQPESQATGQAAEVSAEREIGEETEEENEDMSNELVIYFSQTGNTKRVAQTIAELTNADIYEITPEQPYTDEDLNYNDSSTRATREQNDDSARPQISGSIDSLDQYNVIYLGYPIWWGDMPKILYTFLDEYDLSGKTIAPFCTSGSSGLSGTPGKIAENEPEAEVLDGFHVSGSNSGSSSLSEDAAAWLNENNIETNS